MNKKQLSERDICTKFITPAVAAAGWDPMSQLREEVSFTRGRVIVRGKTVYRGKAKRADYILYYKPNIPLAVIEAKDNCCAVGDGLQQALEYADTLKLPLPPVLEQRRIIKRVGDLMALCGRLEAAQTERERRRTSVSAALHEQLAQSEGADVRQNATLFAANSQCVLMRDAQVRDLKQTILTLAIKGRLVSQDSQDESASALLERVRRDAPASGKARMPLEVDERDEDCFALPDSWRWVRLADIAYGFRYGTSVKCSYETDGEPVLRIPNIANGLIDTDDLKFGKLQPTEVQDLRLELGDILMVRSNGSLPLVGRPAAVEAKVVGFCYAGYLVRVRTSTAHVDPRYVAMALSTKHVRDQIEGPIRSSVGLKNVNAVELGKLRIPLPPLNEQRRIVAKIEDLTSICADLENALKVRDMRARELLEATLSRALDAA
jgi:type I restriction enzyme, S subunit